MYHININSNVTFCHYVLLLPNQFLMICFVDLDFVHEDQFSHCCSLIPDSANLEPRKYKPFIFAIISNQCILGLNSVES